VGHILLCGVSARAAAESAAHAGFDVTALDAFADRDRHPSVRACSLDRRFSASAAADAARNITCDAVAYLSPFENHPDAAAALAQGRTLWGNAPEVLRRVRDPIAVEDALRRRGFPTPRVGRTGDATGQWLLKPLASGGGRRIQPWRPGDPVDDDHYLQEWIEGVPGSIVFVAAAGRACPLGVCRQLVGDAAFGAIGYQYCGNILASGDAAVFEQYPALRDAACALARGVAEEFGLVGVNGVDFVARDAAPYPVEINPRWCASMELVERAYHLGVFGAHAAACAATTLPDFDFVHVQRVSPCAVIGKAVVFARRAVIVGDTGMWLEETCEDGAAAIRDVPHPGERIPAGRPVCTVFAAAPDAQGCHAALARRAERIYAQLSTGEQRSCVL